jgi:hypothetical protein
VLLLALKIVLTPAIVVATSLAGRRFGPAVSGWLVGLPLMSGPITFFFALEHGQRFAARASVGSLSGTLGEGAFCAGWAVLAARGRWWRPLAGASACFAAVALLVEALPLDERLPSPLLPLGVASVAALVVLLRLLPHPPADVAAAALPPTWDLTGRAVVATVILLTLTAVADVLGARLAGLLAVYPLYTAVLAGFAQRNEGGAAAIRVLRGLLLGLFAFVAFYLVLAAALSRIGLGAAFALATGAALGVHAVSLWPLRHERTRRLPPTTAAADA